MSIQTDVNSQISGVLDLNNLSNDEESKSVTHQQPSLCVTSPVISEHEKKQKIQQQILGLEPWMIKFKKTIPELPNDPLSNAEPDKIVTTHLVWEVEAPDFENKILTANATYTYNNKIDGNNSLILDISEDLEISMEDPYAITVNDEPAPFSISKGIGGKPYALKITIPTKKGAGIVSIKYRTSPNASGAFWVEKQYTEGKNHPLLYTLFEPTEGCSVIPGQHTPRVRLTYEIHAKTGDSELMVLSSVNNNPKVRNKNGEYNGLRMNRAVPLYLLSLHVGNFSFKPYEDERTGIYAEDAMLESAAESFKQLPEFLKAAEEICGPYNWGTYCPIILCWAFPYMAMEHPCASTCGAICMEQPTVVPHELAHSWTGNDITNCNWQQFFWNEGWTTFVEYLICEKIWGTDYASMVFYYTMQEALEAMDEFRDSDPEILKLCSFESSSEFTRIPYGKGALFFFMLRDAIGKEDFSQFIKDYMKVFYQSTMSDERFLGFLKAWLNNRKGIENFEKFKADHYIHDWLYETEIPNNAPEIKSALLDDMNLEGKQLIESHSVNADKIKNWDIATQLTFLSTLENKATKDHLIALDHIMGYTASESMSLLGEWSLLCAMKGYYTPSTKKMILDYVIKRNSLHEANKIVTSLCKTDEGLELAKEILNQEMGRLFSVTKDAIAKAISKVQ